MAKKTPIKFGTDGWRSVISDGFTIPNIKRVAQAACDVARETSKSRLILIGYDRRFFSKRFAETASSVALGNGFKVEISKEPLSSPVLSNSVKARKAALGFMITASHNPYYFNGFKLKGPHGGSVDESVTLRVEDRLDTGAAKEKNEKLKGTNFISEYASFLKKFVKFNSFSKLKGSVVFDAMHGPGAQILEEILPNTKKIHFLRKDSDPLFGGGAPEPIEANLAQLKEEVVRKKAVAGFAVDGDADRIGVVDDKGRYLPPHTVMPLLILHMIEGRKLKGKIVQTVSMGYLPGRIAAHFKLDFEEVAVGYKYIGRKIQEGKVLFGGEESGGYGVGLWSPERDGLLCALLLTEMIAMRKQPLSAIVDDMIRRFGESHFKRVDFTLTKAIEKEAWSQHIRNHMATEIGGATIKEIRSTDGLKIVMTDDSWVLLRPSGTEPLIRTYAEASSQKLVDDLLKEADRLVHLPPPKPDKKEKDAAKKAKRAKSK